MPVDPQIQALLDRGAGIPATHTLPVAAARTRQFPGGPRRAGRRRSCVRRVGDAIDPAAFLLGRDNREPELLPQRS